jgi:nucleoside 2-deoxyribosyltransferase
MEAPKKIYLAIPYSGMEESSYEQANLVTSILINEYNFNVFSPITHSHPLTKIGVKGTWDYWKILDFQFIDWADEVYVVIPKEGLIKNFLSTGVTEEIRYAESLGKPISFITLPQFEQNPTIIQKENENQPQ